MDAHSSSADLPAEARTWAMAAHLSALVGALVGGLPAFVGPLVIWLVRKDSDGFTAAHALEALNFNLSVIIYAVAAMLAVILTLGLAIVVIALLFLPAVVLYVVVTLKAAVRANNGDLYRYPLSLRFIS
jgi:uncharacterized protein